MIRLLTASLAGEGYLNFMGNEFGHPEWLDFPREGNGWSYHYCRRQWSLVDNENLRYRELNDFDKAMIDLLKNEKVLSLKTKCRWLHNDDKIIMYTKGDLAFAFNFHPEKSFDGYFVPVEKEGYYEPILTSDDGVFGGYSRVPTDCKYKAYKTPAGWVGFNCYIPNRSVIVFKKTKK
jgi:1,4-alpha-glucan branching enzyme